MCDPRVCQRNRSCDGHHRERPRSPRLDHKVTAMAEGRYESSLMAMPRASFTKDHAAAVPEALTRRRS